MLKCGSYLVLWRDGDGPWSSEPGAMNLDYARLRAETHMFAGRTVVIARVDQIGTATQGPVVKRWVVSESPNG